MSNEITTAFVQQYKNNVQLLLQQRGSKLRGLVSSDTYVGKAGKVVEQIGATAARRRTTRHGDMPLMNTPHDARWVYPHDYDWADLIDKQDKMRMLIDPTSSYAQSAAFALGRSMDDEIIDAFFGTAKTGEDGDTSTAFDTSNQVVAVGTGAAAATGLNVTKLRGAKKILLANEWDPDMEPVFCGITAEQHDELLAEAQVVSTDFNDRPVLVDGRVQRFLGINFVLIERLDTDGDGYRRCPVWVPSGMHLGIWGDIDGDISRRTDKSGRPWQVSADMTVGATRLDEKKVVEIKCSEA